MTDLHCKMRDTALKELQAKTDCMKKTPPWRAVGNWHTHKPHTCLSWPFSFLWFSFALVCCKFLGTGTGAPNLSPTPQHYAPDIFYPF